MSVTTILMVSRCQVSRFQSPRRNGTLKKSKMAAAAILNYGQMAFLVVLFCTNLKKLTQISQSWAKLWLRFRNPNGGRRHVVSAKMMILATLSTTWCHSASAYQIWWESAHPRRTNGTWILVEWHFCHMILFPVLFCTYTQNFSQIPHSRAKLWLCFFFKNSRWRPSAILEL